MTSDWQSSRLKRVQAAAIATLAYPLINALGHTFRWRVEGLQHLDAIVASGRQPVMAFWHGRILPATFYFRRRGIVVITSENFDGEWIARIIERLGFRAVRGSSSRGGAAGLRGMQRELEAGHPVDPLGERDVSPVSGSFRGDTDDANHVAGAVLGLAATGLAVLSGIGLLLAPVIMRGLVSGVGDAAVREAQVELGVFFLWFFLPPHADKAKINRQQTNPLKVLPALIIFFSSLDQLRR